MEKANFIFFCIGALSLAFGIIAKPYVDTLVMRLKRLFTRKERTIEDNNLEVIVNQVNDLQTQVDNIAEQLATRDRNRKYNTRREVRDYLAELRSDK